MGKKDSNNSGQKVLGLSIEVSGCAGACALLGEWSSLPVDGVERLQLTLYGLEETHDQFARI